MRIVGNPPSGGKKPTTPTIGTATDDGTGTGVSVAFTPSTYIGKGTITYTATSSPGSLTNTGSGSPIVVSGLTTGTAYTFTVTGNTNYGVASDASAASNSVTPASPTSFESISTVTASGGETTITFSSIPSTYKHLQIRYISRTATGPQDLFIRFNSDTGSNYSYHSLYGIGSGTGTSTAGATQTKVVVINGAGSATASMFAGGVIDILDYQNTNKNKTVRALTGFDTNNATTSVNNETIAFGSGLWYATPAAINTVTITLSGSSWAQYSTFALYGIK